MSLKISVPNIQFENFVDILPTVSFDFGSGNLKNSGVGNKIKELSFSRSSSAYRTNEQGLLEPVAQNTPRFEYDPITLKPKGLLVEGSSQNELLYSEDYQNSAWQKNNLSIGDSVLAPDGTLTAKKLLSSATASRIARFSQSGASIASGRFVTASAYFKKSDFSTVTLQVSGAFTDGFIKYNFDTGNIDVVGAGVYHYTIEDAPNGFKRLSVTVKAGSTGNAVFDIILSNSAGALYYEADGTKGTYVWGCQLEVDKPFSTSYIKTISSKATRSADIVLGVSEQNIGVNSCGLYAEYFTKHKSSEFLEFLAHLGESNNARLAFGFKNGPIASSRTLSTVEILESSMQDDVKKLNKALVFQDSTKLAISVNGGLNTRQVSNYPSNLKSLRIGAQIGSGAYPDVGDFFGIVKNVSIYELSLDDELIRNKTLSDN
jgi:hypothetical protein